MQVLLLYIGRGRKFNMLSDSKNDLFHLLGVLESIGKIQKYTIDIKTPEEFIDANDQMIYNACLTLLANIGESIGKLSSYSSQHLKDLEINAIRGMRNRIVHDYSGLDTYVVYKVTKNDLNAIKDKIDDLINKSINDKMFDVEEYELAKASSYYKHVNFN